MSKKRKHKKKIVQPQISGYKKFLLDMHETLKLTGLESDLTKFSTSDKRKMYAYRVRNCNPEAIDGTVSSHDLEKITQRTKYYYRKGTVESCGTKLSVYQIMLIYCYLTIKAEVLEKVFKDKHHPTVVTYRKHSKDLFSAYSIHFIVNYTRAIIQMSSPDYKYFGVNMRTGALYKDNPCLEHKPELYADYPQKKMMKVNGVIRPAFRLGKMQHALPVEWISINSALLKNTQEPLPEKLAVYIQSHALKRMAQRLDLLEKPAVNHALWDNTNKITAFTFHKGYYLLPVKLYDCKVGYLLADIIYGKLLFKTFLFITHNFTPEGDKLRRISGLGKEDVSYWKIDRLSTFAKLNEAKYPALTRLFEQAGLADLFHLKDKDFDVEMMQEANLEGLMRYINRGRNVEKVQKQEFDALLQNA